MRSSSSPKTGKSIVVRIGRLPVECLVPGYFDGIVGVLPFELFRPQRVKLERAEGLRVFILGSGWVACDGVSHDIEHGKASPIGDFIGFRVTNTTDKETRLLAVLHGRTVMTSGDIVGRVLRGACL